MNVIDLENSEDFETAKAFSNSLSHCFSASPYSIQQVIEWLEPVKLTDLANCTLCELGCGNGGLLQYVAHYTDKKAFGVDLGRSIKVARGNFEKMNIRNVDFVRDDLRSFSFAHADRFDFVYSIGVLHHMKHPEEGFSAILRATRPGGRFHCWVYGHEGNLMVRRFVDPARRVVSHLPWWAVKYAMAFPLALPFYLTSQLIRVPWIGKAREVIPMYPYLKWISGYRFRFHHHVAFDQIVSRHTVYIKKETIEQWLRSKRVKDTYIISRNGNSWKFGGVKRR